MKRFKLENDFIDFVELCNKYGVEYLIIGMLRKWYRLFNISDSVP